MYGLKNSFSSTVTIKNESGFSPKIYVLSLLFWLLILIVLFCFANPKSGILLRIEKQWTFDKILSKKKLKRIYKWSFCKYLKLEIKIAYTTYFFNDMNQE